MRVMVTLTPKCEHDEAIRWLIGAEQPRVAEWRHAGALEQLSVSRPGRAWLVLVAESAAEAERSYRTSRCTRVLTQRSSV